MRSRLYAATITIAVTVLVGGLTACGSSDTTARPEASATSTAAAPSAEAQAEATPLAVPPLKVGPAVLGTARHQFSAERTDLVNIPGGTFNILTVNGKTAYRFEEDGDKPSKVNCHTDCPVVWPPVLTDGAPVTVEGGAKQGLVGSVKREDGHVQVTYNGWPLYWFEKDASAGDALGEGLGGNWSTVTTDGKAVFKKPARTR